MAGVLVEGDELVSAGRGGIDPMCTGDGDDAVHVGQPRDGPHHRLAPQVDVDDFAGTHVGDEQSTPPDVECHVVESDRAAGQSGLADTPQRKVAVGLRWARTARQRGAEHRNKVPR